MAALYRFCPSCGDEFQHWVSECPDCRVALHDRDPSVPASVAPEFAAPAAVDLAEFVCVRSADVWQLRTLAERMHAAGIACRVDGYPPGAGIDARRASSRIAPRGTATQIGLYVRRADFVRAREIEHAERIEGTPDLPEGAVAAGDELEGCPGCGTPIDPAREDCAECGLAFPPLEIACARCGEAVDAAAEQCPHCDFRG